MVALLSCVMTMVASLFFTLSFMWASKLEDRGKKSDIAVISCIAFMFITFSCWLFFVGSLVYYVADFLINLVF